MAQAKRTRRTPQEIADAEEAKLRALQARLAQKQAKAALSYYQAADRGRRNRDNPAKYGSADQNLIPEHLTIVARARLSVANTWIGKSAKRAFVRNVIGRGIEIVPTARDAKGKDLPELNARAADLFSRWASDRTAVDVEARRTWWQMQRSLASEKFIAGQVFLIWSYVPHPKRVGLTLQLVEHEQLDLSLQVYGDNEVRGGIEVDSFGRPVAYHFYKRSPNDYLRSDLDSIRVPAERVLHLFDPDRAQQTHGEPELTPVLQDVRDFKRMHDAHLWRAMMEACIGLIIKKNFPTQPGVSPTLPYASGDTGQTASGMKTASFVPGMVWEGLPGEEISAFSPSTPGNGFEPFTDLTLRGIGAGLGMSLGSLTRKNDANYSAARQDMLEDEREIAPQQDAFIDQIATPVYEMFYSFAVAEGKLDIPDFYEDPDRYTQAEYIPPVRPWIDPEKEINAYAKAIEYRLATRAEIVAQRGGRFANIIRQIKAEKDIADADGITLPEDVEATSTLTTAEADKARGDAEMVKADAAKTQAESSEPASLRKIAERLKVIDAPNYRPGNEAMKCGTCSLYAGGKCSAYDFESTPAWVCDSWEAKPMPASAGGGIGEPPPLPEGETPFDRTSARDDH